jgi:hypothetical protein
MNRASGEPADLALKMYHNPKMLRTVLRDVRRPDDGERVAVSLAPEDEGPYLVTSIKGRFVTCLAPGMSLGGLRLIPHAQLVSHIERYELNRRRLERAKEIVGEGGELKKLIARLDTMGQHISQEEILGLAGVQPAIKWEFLVRLSGAQISLMNLGGRLLAHKKLDKKSEPLIEKYWRSFWAACHYICLGGMTGVQGIARAFELMQKKKPVLPLFWTLSVSGAVSIIMRLAWFVGKMGKPFFSECKRMLLSPRFPEDWLLGLLGCMVIGQRHAKLNGQAIKAIKGCVESARDYPPSVRRLIFKASSDVEVTAKTFFLPLIESDVICERYIGVAKGGFFECFQNISMPEPYRWRSAEEVPPGLALAFNAQQIHSVLVNPQLLPILTASTAWLARCEAEDFYFPHDFDKRFKRKWDPEAALQLIRSDHEVWGKTKPITSNKTAGRNDPCPCGSGKKYKKCCME